MKGIGWTEIRMLVVFFLLFAVGVFTGCAPALSKNLRDEAGEPVPFEALQQQADAYKDRVVILGGYILETVNEPDGTLLVVLQAPLDSRNSPNSSDLSKGRFLVQTTEFLDPVIYSKDRKVTVGGRVIGSRQKQLGNIMYEYPVIDSQEIHLWPNKVVYTRPYYYPYYYPYYDPWYYPWRYPWYRYPRGHRHPYW